MGLDWPSFAAAAAAAAKQVVDYSDDVKYDVPCKRDQVEGWRHWVGIHVLFNSPDAVDAEECTCVT